MLTVLRHGRHPLLLTQCQLATGRSCLMHLIDRYGPEEVFMPTMVPEGLVAPFEKKEIPMRHYGLNADLSPNVDSLHRQIEFCNRRQRRFLTVVVHYFGYPMPTAEAAAATHYLGGLLLSDCAMATYHPDPNENCADLTLYSINKFLPVPDGALLVSCSPDADVTPTKELKPLDDAIINSYLNHLTMNRLVAKIGEWNEYTQRAYVLSNRRYEEYYKAISEDMTPHCMSKYGRAAYELFDFAKISEERRNNAKKIITHLRRRSLYRLDAPDFALPIRCGKYRRQDVYEALKAKGILASTIQDKWRGPGEQEYVLKDFWNQHLLLPIHQDLTAAQLGKIATEARRWT